MPHRTKGYSERHLCRIKISDKDEIIPGTRERIATISGPIPALMCAQHLITAILHPQPADAMDQSGQTEGAEQTAADGETAVLKLLFPHISCGAVMGRGGAFIKELMESSGATIKVSQPNDMIAATQERVITITGTPAAIDHAQNAICVRMEDAPPAQHIRMTDYSVLKGGGTMMPPMAAGGWPGARPPMVAPGMPAMPPRMPPPAGVISYKQFMATLDDYVTPADAQRKYDEYLRHAQMSAGRPAAPAFDSGAVSRLEMSLSDRAVSAVIGKGGSVVRDIVNATGSKIHASPKAPDKPEADRTITITGTNHQIEMARQIIMQRVQMLEAGQAPPQLVGFSAPQLPLPYGSAPPQPEGFYGGGAQFGAPSQW
uniref:K Homology domain-containing protein n=1 Tax=Chrysotila carterae TaxID=13221 RepID=A0A7S4FCI9_CHRCT